MNQNIKILTTLNLLIFLFSCSPGTKKNQNDRDTNSSSFSSNAIKTDPPSPSTFTIDEVSMDENTFLYFYQTHVCNKFVFKQFIENNGHVGAVCFALDDNDALINGSSQYSNPFVLSISTGPTSVVQNPIFGNLVLHRTELNPWIRGKVVNSLIFSPTISQQISYNLYIQFNPPSPSAVHPINPSPPAPQLSIK